MSSLFVRGQLLESRDRNIVGEILENQFILKDGNSGSMLWSTGLLGDQPFCLAFQDDGNLVIYSQNEEALWASNSMSVNAHRMVLTNDGALSLLNSDGNIYWST